MLPHRHPVLAAKMLATVDVLSKGRLTVGVGVGWMSEEIALLGGPPFADRAKASDEYIEAFREMWTAERPAPQGSYAAFDKMLFAPKTKQLPHAPIWVGGEVAGARKRAGRLWQWHGTPSPLILAFHSIPRSSDGDGLAEVRAGGGTGRP